MLEITLAWLPRLFEAALLTLALSAVIFGLSGVLGLGLAVLVSERRSPWPRRIAEAFSAAFRSLPELVILFLFFFGGPQLGVDLGPVASTIVAFVLVGIAFDYQVFKGALSVIPRGQFDAGRALGLSGGRLLGLIILPQMLPIARKGWITYAIATVKRLSIASAVSVSEIMYVTKQGIAATNAPFLFLSLAVALYILIVAPLLAFNERPMKAVA
jgi:His/Glu/Gln/Arg/opine family amino acid ABC transporter permease subunit